jgi:hypothetical protein
MQKPEINQLYRYYSNEAWAVDVIQNQRIFCSLRSTFNDPFDGSIPFSHEISPADYVEFAFKIYRKDGYDWPTIRGLLDRELSTDGSLNAKAQKRIAENAAKFHEENNRAGILCLNDDPLSVLMWSHYACKHQGICIGFARTDQNQLGCDDVCSPVTYSDEYPAPKFSEILSGNGKLTEKLFYVKAREWAYEREWRLLCEQGGQHIDLSFPISQIILGCRCPDDRIARFKEIAAAQAIALYQTKIVEGRFALVTSRLA